MGSSVERATIQPLFIFAYTALALTYIYFRVVEPWQGELVVKVLPLIMLLVLIRKALEGTGKLIMTAALCFSMLGDVFMSLDGFFLLGVGFFLIAQINYCALFLRDAQWQANRLPWLMLIVMYVAGMALWILPQTGDLKWVVLGYMCAIACMAIAAGYRNSANWLWVSIGALIFMISDTLIAINKFAFPIELSGLYIMATYYLAQILITYGILKDHKNHS